LALEVRALKRHPNGTAAFVEEGVVRRELSDNFVYYTPDDYDSLISAADWARESLELHSTDERESVYTWKELEKGMTHDDLWNAAQLQLVREGGMHGFVSFTCQRNDVVSLNRSHIFITGAIATFSVENVLGKENS
jgi:deoxyribodipyrimidine photo-lyase